MPYSRKVRSGNSQSGNKGSMGELDLIRRIRGRASGSRSGALRLGIGDDCALLRPRAGEELAVTTDLSIAGRHFRLDWHPPQSVGHRTLARGLSDLAAMGARPMAAFLSLGLPRELIEVGSTGRSTARAGKSPARPHARSRAWIDEFLDGFLALADATETPLAGGDLAESPIFAADIVLIGAVPHGKALLRSGARPGDLLYVTGALGRAAAGLDRLAEWATGQPIADNTILKGNGALENLKARGAKEIWKGHGALEVLKGNSASDILKGHGFSRANIGHRKGAALAAEGWFVSPARRTPKHIETLLAPHLYPQPRLAQGLWLVRRGLATAALDISDGLSTDLAHLCEESRVAAQIRAASLPIAAGATPEEALHGGEDYELLFTASPSAKIPRAIAGVPVTQIGRIVRRSSAQPTMTLITETGRQPLEPRGWEHFSTGYSSGNSGKFRR